MRSDSEAGDFTGGRVDLQPGQYVQGCLVEEGVYAEVDSAVAVVVGS